MASGFCAEPLVDGFDRLLGRLLCGEAGPIEMAEVERAAGVLQVAFGLVHPIGAALHARITARWRGLRRWSSRWGDRPGGWARRRGPGPRSASGTCRGTSPGTG